LTQHNVKNYTIPREISVNIGYFARHVEIQVGTRRCATQFYNTKRETYVAKLS